MSAKPGKNTNGGSTITTEVDGQKAVVKQHPEVPQQDLPQFPLIVVPEGAYESMQLMFDEGIFKSSMNLVTGAKVHPCQAEASVDGIVVKCPHRAVLQSAEVDECGTCHRKKKVIQRRLCLAHGAIHWGAKAPVMLQMELGEDDEQHEHGGNFSAIREAAQTEEANV